MKNLIMVSIRFNNNMSENKLTKFNWLCREYLINPELSRITKFNYGIDTIHLAIELLLLSLRLGKRSPGMITEKFVLLLPLRCFFGATSTPTADLKFFVSDLSPEDLLCILSFIFV